MYNFALKEISELQGKLKIFKLLVNGSCEYDDFESEIQQEGNLTSELRTIEVRLFEIADLKSLPQSKFKDITPKNDSSKEYEIKTHNLRVYLFHDEYTGHLIVCGGKKGTQKADIKRFREIKKQYLKQKK